MTDATNQPVSPPAADPAPQATSGDSFLATTRGKLIAGGAVLALLVIAGVVGAAIFLFGGSLLSNSGGSNTGPTATQPPATTSAGAAAAPAVNPAEKPLSSSFTFRNVFAPTVMPPSTEATGIGDPEPEAPAPAPTSGTETTPAATPVVTLTLTDIITEGDAHKGVFTYGTATYTAGNGETIGSSPWKVLEVGTDSVLMLYGDTQMTITIGQGISK